MTFYQERNRIRKPAKQLRCKWIPKQFYYPTTMKDSYQCSRKFSTNPHIPLKWATVEHNLPSSTAAISVRRAVTTTKSREWEGEILLTPPVTPPPTHTHLLARDASVYRGSEPTERKLSEQLWGCPNLSWGDGVTFSNGAVALELSILLK